MIQRPSLVRPVRDDHGRRVAAGLAVKRGAPEDPLHHVQFGVFADRLVDRARQHLSFPGAAAVLQRADELVGELLARDVIGVPHLRCDRGQVVVPVRLWVIARVHHRTAQGEVDQVRTPVVSPRPGVTKRRHAGVYQPRKPLSQRVATETQAIEGAPARALEQHVGPLEEFLKARAVCPRLKVQEQRSLPQVVVPEVERVLRSRFVPVKGPDAARGRALRRLDLEHVRAQAREQAPAVLRLLVGQLHHPHVGQVPVALLPTRLRHRAPRCVRSRGRQCTTLSGSVWIR